MPSSHAPAELSRGARYAVLAAAFAGLVFDGFELGLMPVASLPITKSLLGEEFTDALGNMWFARFTASLMLGAAIGGSLLGNLGDRIGRSRAMGVSILFYSVFAGLGMLRPHVRRDARAAISGRAWRRRHVAQRRRARRRVLAPYIAADGVRHPRRGDQRRHPYLLANRPHLAHHAGLVAVDLRRRGRPGGAGRLGARRVAGVAQVARVARANRRRPRRRCAGSSTRTCGGQRLSASCWRRFRWSAPGPAASG